MLFDANYFLLRTTSAQPCPSGMSHTVVERVVKNIYGKQYCLHPDCRRANLEEVDPRGGIVKG